MLRPAEELDGGYGWIVCAASFLAHVVVLGSQYSIGVLLSSIIDELGQRALTSFVSSIAVATMLFSGVFVGRIVGRVGPRAAVFLGAAFTGAGMGLGSLAASLPVLFLTFGLVTGFGFSLGFAPSVFVVNEWVRGFLAPGARGARRRDSGTSRRPSSTSAAPWPTASPSPAVGSAPWCFRPSWSCSFAGSGGGAASRFRPSAPPCSSASARPRTGTRALRPRWTRRDGRWRRRATPRGRARLVPSRRRGSAASATAPFLSRSVSASCSAPWAILFPLSTWCAPLAPRVPGGPSPP